MVEDLPFYKYKNLFNNALANKGEPQQVMCNDNIKANLGGVEKIYNENDFNNVCPVAIYYLADLSQNSYKDMDEGCKYLYYGIYNNILKKDEYDYDKLEFYKMILKGYHSFNDWESYESYVDMINGDILEQNKDLMEMYYNLDNFKEKINQGKNERCKYVNTCIEIYRKYAEKYKTNNDSFCAELNKFIERYNKHMEKDFPCENSQNFLPYIGRSNLKIILIPIILITLKLFILYILYKLTPLRSWIHILLRRKKGIQNNIDQRNYQLHNLSKQNKSAFTNRSYNITYISVNDS